jgi:hypothetical protein
MWLLDVFNNDFEVDEAMIHGVERPCKLIFNILAIVKSDLLTVKWFFK